MSLDFNQLLTTDQKRGILAQRVQQFALEAYQHHLNQATAEAVGNEELAAVSRAALVELEAAIKINQAALEALPTE